jgi:hypothetical protein
MPSLVQACCDDATCGARHRGLCRLEEIALRIRCQSPAGTEPACSQITAVASGEAVIRCSFGYSAIGIRSHRIDMKTGYRFQ